MRVDDLEAGQWVAVVGMVEKEDEGGWAEQERSAMHALFFGSVRTRQAPPIAVGVPLRVVAVSPPFAAARSKKGVHRLDLRSVLLVRVTEEYAKAFDEEREGEAPKIKGYSGLVLNDDPDRLYDE